MTFVLDNSVAMRWLFADGSENDLAYADRILGALADGDGYAVAPGIWPLETANVIARAERKGLLKEARASEFLRLLDGLGVEIDPETEVTALGATLQLARRFELSAYDASYLELALREGLPLATLDKDLLAAAERTGIAAL